MAVNAYQNVQNNIEKLNDIANKIIFYDSLILHNALALNPYHSMFRRRREETKTDFEAMQKTYVAKRRELYESLNALYTTVKNDSQNAYANMQSALSICSQNEVSKSKTIQPFIDIDPRKYDTSLLKLDGIDFQVYRVKQGRAVLLFLAGTWLNVEPIKSELEKIRIDNASNRQTGGAFLPLITDNQFHNKDFMVIVNPTKEIIKIITHIWNCVLLLNRNITNQEFILPFVRQKTGILGVTLTCKLYPMFQDILNRRLRGFYWNPIHNPRLLNNGKYLFLVEKYTFSEDIYSAISLLKRELPLPNFFETYLSIEENNTQHPNPLQLFIDNRAYFIDREFYRFLADPNYSTATMGWGGHARALYKDSVNKILYIYDPAVHAKIQRKDWYLPIVKRFVESSILTNTAYSALGLPSPGTYTVEILSRESIDQEFTIDASCVILSVIRALLMSQYGLVGSAMPIPCQYAIFIQRLFNIILYPIDYIDIPYDDFNAVKGTIEQYIKYEYPRDYSFNRNAVALFGLFTKQTNNLFVLTKDAINASALEPAREAVLQYLFGLYVMKTYKAINALYDTINDINVKRGYGDLYQRFQNIINGNGSNEDKIRFQNILDFIQLPDTNNYIQTHRPALGNCNFPPGTIIPPGTVIDITTLETVLISSLSKFN
jgi:hypothetical protein